MFRVICNESRKGESFTFFIMEKKNFSNDILLFWDKPVFISQLPSLKWFQLFFSVKKKKKLPTHKQ